MRTYLTLLLLFLPSMLFSQERLGLKPPPTTEQISTAKQTIAAANSAPVILPYGGYALIDIDVDGELVPYIVPGSDDVLRIETVAKGKAFEGWHVKKGESQFTWVSIPADDKVNRLKVSGIANGSQTILWMSIINGKPVVVKGYKFDVGKQQPKPDDPIPVDDPLVKSLKEAIAKDIAAGKANKQWLLPLAGVYRKVGNDNLDTYATMSDLDTKLFNERVAAGIPEPEVMYPALRKALQAELYSQLGINANSGNVALKVDTRRIAKATMANIAAALTEVAK